MCKVAMPTRPTPDVYIGEIGGADTEERGGGEMMMMYVGNISLTPCERGWE